MVVANTMQEYFSILQYDCRLYVIMKEHEFSL